jgi:hypothetical protein
MDFLAERGFMTNTSRASLAGLMCIAGGLLFTFKPRGSRARI